MEIMRVPVEKVSGVYMRGGASYSCIVGTFRLNVDEDHAVWRDSRGYRTVDASEIVGVFASAG